MDVKPNTLKLEPRQENHGETSVIVGPLGVVCEFDSAVWDDRARLSGPAKLDREYVALFLSSPALRAALGRAERFISGFEGDEMQEGVDDLLKEIRRAIADADKRQELPARPAGKAKVGIGPHR